VLYREIIALCSQIHTKHINTLCRQNEELLNVKMLVGTYGEHWALKGEISVIESNHLILYSEMCNRCLFSDSHKIRKYIL
jgi:hypothetical protein